MAVARPGVLASASLTLAFTAVWTVQAARSDDTGLAGVGAIMLLFGLSAATALVSVVVGLFHRRRAGRRRS